MIWETAAQIADVPPVDESLRNFLADPTEDNGTAIVAAVMEAALNSPEIQDFAEGLFREAAHQRERWGTAQDAGKTPEDWLWLIGYLTGKAVRGFREAEKLTELATRPGVVYGKDELLRAAAEAREKGIHHIITTAAACANWHLHVTGVDTRMRPGHAEEKFPV